MGFLSFQASYSSSREETCTTNIDSSNERIFLSAFLLWWCYYLQVDVINKGGTRGINTIISNHGKREDTADSRSYCDDAWIIAFCFLSSAGIERFGTGSINLCGFLACCFEFSRCARGAPHSIFQRVTICMDMEKMTDGTLKGVGKHSTLCNRPLLTRKTNSTDSNIFYFLMLK